MVTREVRILETAASTIAEIAYFIESKGLPQTAKKFVNDIFSFIEKLADKRIVHKPCKYERWTDLNYRCVSYKKKYVIAYLNHTSEIVICDIVSFKMLF
ncbi:type II toxin-antitoxin system RelE/ParE family toxin [Niabella sp.]|uniref:type II toxin-antitoxin system RelE/ParE family toxin n=1 Tax=Niabella sp. TaxID=1962976 RepID=UPI0034559DB7